MKAVMLVGGMGTRLRPLTYRIPKPLVPVMGRPLMMYVISALPYEVDEVIIPVSYKKEMMLDYITKNPPNKKITLVDEPTPLGTGGAVKNVEDHLEGEGTFLVVNGDSLTSMDFGAFLKFHHSKGGIATISLWTADDVTQFGIVDLDENGRIRRFQEKPKKEEAFSNLINAGTYALEEEVLSYIPKGFVSMERDVFPLILDQGMYGFGYKGYWIDCGNRETLLQGFWTLMGKDHRRVDAGVVREGATVTPPVAVKEGAVIAGATIGPYAYISERAVVGLRTRVERSVLYEDARIGPGCTIIDSIIDAGTTVQDGSVIKGQIVSAAKEPAAK